MSGRERRPKRLFTPEELKDVDPSDISGVRVVVSIFLHNDKGGLNITYEEGTSAEKFTEMIDVLTTLRKKFAADQP